MKTSASRIKAHHHTYEWDEVAQTFLDLDEFATYAEKVYRKIRGTVTVYQLNENGCRHERFPLLDAIDSLIGQGRVERVQLGARGGYRRTNEVRQIEKPNWNGRKREEAI